MTRQQAGFTMVELLVTFAVLATLAGIAIPIFSVWLPNYRLKSATMDIYSHFQKAKMEAIRRNDIVVLRFNVAGDSCEVFVDNGSGGGTAQDGIRNGTEPLVSRVSTPDNIDILSASFSGSPACGFTSRGLPWNSRIGNTELKNTKNRHYRVILSIAGNVRMEVSRDGGATWN